MDIFNEILWPQFLNLEGIRNLPINEQVAEYNRYLSELTNRRNYYLQQQDWLAAQEKSGDTRRYILLEDGYYLLQEDGSKIKIY